nr:unnamed protein product [Callosobruchus chinensis]
MKHKLSVGHLNIQSIVPKLCDLRFYLENEKLDILGISETWLTDMVTSDVLYIEGYSLIRKDREVGRGGGVLIYIKDSLKYQAIDVSGNIEQLFVKINCRDYNFVLGVAYKPPTVNYKYFIDSLEVSFTIASTHSENILFLGDVNINFLSADSVATKYFNSMLTSLGLNQLVSEPTHITDHSTSLIDIVLTNKVNFIDSTFVRASNFSLHECVGCNIKFMKPRNEPKYFTYRDFKNFDADSFHHDLSSSNLDHIFFVSDVDEKIKLFNSILTTLFEKHVPLKTIQITRRKAPWINDRIKMLMSERDKARAKLKRNKTDSNLKQYRDLRNRTNFEILKLKQEFFSKLSNVRDTKKVWNELRQLNVNHTSSNHISDTFPDPDILNNHFVDSIPQTCRLETSISSSLDVVRFRRLENLAAKIARAATAPSTAAQKMNMPGCRKGGSCFVYSAAITDGSPVMFQVRESSEAAVGGESGRKK